jgi:hypothetical protein
MTIEYKTVPSLQGWLQEKTAGCRSVVELGAGFFDKLGMLSETVNQRIGIELMGCYIDNAKFKECAILQGDALNYKALLPESCLYDTVLMISFLEHVTMDEGKALIASLKEDFNRILLVVPCGLFDQEEDVTGFGCHEAQTHKSFWYEEDILTLDFQENVVDKLFHKGNPLAKHDKASAFCVWER